MSWTTIESDPGVFTELIQQFGVKGVQVEEFYDIEQSSFDKAKPIYGLIFLFKWQKDEKDNRQPDPKADHVFFAKQVINNACATQAIINVLLNRSDLELGPELTKFKQFAEPLPSDIRGMAMQNSAVLRTVHNSFARPDPFEAFHENRKDDDDDDEAFHFVGYVPVADVVYELDGLKGGPIKVGEVKDGKDWLEVARGALQERISRYQAKEVRFNVMGLVKNKKEVATAELKDLESKLAAAGAGAGAADIKTQITAVKERIAIEDERFAAWKAENIRRRHNYVPFAYALLKTLSEKGKLKGLVDGAVKANEDRKKKKEEDKKKEAEKKAAAAAAAKTGGAAAAATAPKK